MPIDQVAYHALKRYCDERGVQLIAVSKTKSNEDIMSLYELGHRDFGENYVQELVKKQEELPKDIRWHFIGHLQSNKIKYIAPFVSLIHGVDSAKLLQAIDKEARKVNRQVYCLLQVHIAQEETKFGFDLDELRKTAAELFLEKKYSHVSLKGLMGMASFTSDETIIAAEFQGLKSIFDEIKVTYKSDAEGFNTLSMGMSSDYKIAVEYGTTMIRAGSILFGAREYKADS